MAMSEDKIITDIIEAEKAYIENLKDEIIIKFYVNYNDDTINHQEFVNEYLENKDHKECYHGFGDLIEQDDKTYYNCVRYPEYIESLEPTNPCKVEIYNPDEIIYPKSHMIVHFGNYIMNSVTFTIKAAEYDKGFTRKDLIDKVMKYYHMIYNINLHYNLDEGEMYSEPLLEHNGKTHVGPIVNNQVFDLFFPLCPNNGICGLVYDKNKDMWIVEWEKYI